MLSHQKIKGTTQNTIGAKSKSIRDMFKMTQLDQRSHNSRSCSKL